MLIWMFVLHIRMNELVIMHVACCHLNMIQILSSCKLKNMKFCTDKRLDVLMDIEADNKREPYILPKLAMETK